MNNKLLILPVATLLAGGFILTSATQASAFSFGSKDGQSLISKISQAFGKSEQEVQTVFTQYHQDRVEEREEQYQEALDQAVSNGQITDEQKQLLLEKHQENREQREADFENWQNLTSEEKREQMQEHRKEMLDWANENDIDLQSLNLGRSGEIRGRGRHNGDGCTMFAN